MSDTPANPHGADDDPEKPADELLPLIYEELHRIASREMASEEDGHTLQTTALVHEAWLQLAGNHPDSWSSQRSFLAAAAEVMRHILLDRARRKARVRHGQGLTRVDLDNVEIAAHTSDDTLLRMDDALTRFAREDSEKAELVKLRFFVGLTIPEAAAALGIPERTAKQWWAYARAWLYADLRKGG